MPTFTAGLPVDARVQLAATLESMNKRNIENRGTLDVYCHFVSPGNIHERSIIQTGQAIFRGICSTYIHLYMQQQLVKKRP